VLYIGWVAGEIVIAIGTRRRSKAKETRDRGTQLLLWVAIVLSLNAVGFMEALVPTSFRWDAAWLRPLSLMLMISGITVRAAAIATLGRWFTANVITQPEQTAATKRIVQLGASPLLSGYGNDFRGNRSTFPSLARIACRGATPHCRSAQSHSR